MKLTLRFQRCIFTAMIAAATIGCARDDEAETSFAHYRPDSLLGSPIGMLESLRAGHKTNFDTIRICVEKPTSGPTVQEFVLESRLAYASWLTAAGIDSEQDWQKFEFVASARCSLEDPDFASAIKIATAGENRPDAADMASSFNTPVISCVHTASSFQCNGSGVVRGVGGPGGLRTWLQSGGHWTRLELAFPARLLLSAYIDWRTIRWSVLHNKSISTETRALLANDYESLLRTPSPSFRALMAFNRQLERHGIEEGEDLGFSRAMQEFRDNNLASGKRTYRGEAAMFHTLLHEVGHQFGMDHADNPSGNSHTGPSTAANQDSAGRWITKKATMAYGDAYFYLTEDDRAGIRAALKSVRSHIEAHR